jgi:hypothetical protein
MTPFIRGALGLLGCLAALTGCSRDPYQRNDVWYPTNANTANLAAMVANPNDLVAGRSDNLQPASSHVMAIEKIKLDTPKKLIELTGAVGG